MSGRSPPTSMKLRRSRLPTSGSMGREARACRGEPADDHVLLQAAQVVLQAVRGRFRRHPSGLLERGCRDERFRRKGRLGDAEQHRLQPRGLLAVLCRPVVTGSGRFVFPSLRTVTRPISEGTVNAALRRLGFSKEDMTGHGFRTMASTLLNEQGWHPDLIELQLAHAERNKVRAAYTARSGLMSDGR
jgi:integrase